MKYAEAEAFLYGLPQFAIQGEASYAPGLERIEALLEAVGRPDRQYPCVHLAGTNGKGSTASMLAAIATAAGRRVGLHTSPHLFSLRERLRIDGQPATEADLVALLGRLKPHIEHVGASFFEALVALSLLHFQEERVDLAVIETGLGGRLDATNIVTPVLAVITHIGWDHMTILGDSLPTIAREKAGIIKPGVPVLSAVEQPDCQAVIARIAGDRAAPYHDGRQEVRIEAANPSLTGVSFHAHTPVGDYPDIFLDVLGQHQVLTAALALRAAEMVLGSDLPQDAVYRGLRNVRSLAGLEGRLDIRCEAPMVVLDVAHNPEGIALAVDFMKTHVAGLLVVALGLMQDKDLDALMPMLAGCQVAAISMPSERAFDAGDLADRLTHKGVPAMPFSRLREAFQWFIAQANPQDGLLITGSHQVVAQWPACSFPPPSMTTPQSIG